MRTERTRLTEKLDDIVRDVVRLRDEDTCQRCMKYVTGSNSQPSHVKAKGHGASWRRFDLLNIKLLCNACHRWWHLNPTESGDWFRKKFPSRYRYIKQYYSGGKASPITTHEMRELLEKLKEKAEGLR